jgi:lipopolysaccharide export system protein LptC
MRAWTGASFPLAILICLSLLTLWLRQAVELPEMRSSNKGRHDPDTVIEGLQAAQLDVEGRPLYRLEAARLVHYPDDDTTEISAPRLHYTPAEEAPVTLVAKRGKLLGKGDVVELYDDVRVERAASTIDPGWSAEMPQLTAYPNEARAATASDFVFMQGAARLTGTGFTFDQRARTLDLHANVRGEMPPRSASLPARRH